MKKEKRRAPRERPGDHFNYHTDGALPVLACVGRQG
jgi:hypothetical protein